MTLSPVQAAVNTLSQRFAVIPIVAGEKRAAVEWKPYQTHRPTRGELRTWFSDADRNVAVVCGGVSGGLAVLDIDDPKLADRVADDVGLQAETTLIRTPRGGLHVYVLAADPSRSGPLVPGVADLRAEGGYVLVPPSTIEGRGYVAVSNSSIMSVQNARVWALGLLRSFDVQVGGPPTSGAKAGAAGGLIPEGARNATLISLAGSMRRRGMTPEGVCAALLAENAARCRPPLPEDEVRTIAASAARYEPAAVQVEEGAHDGPGFPRTDAGNGEMFAHLYGDRLRYDHRRKRWVVWAEHWWVPDADAQVRRMGKAAARWRYQDAANIPDLEEREKEARWAIASESRMRLDALLAQASTEKPIADSGEGWDSDPWLLGVGNGVIDLQTGQLRAGRQKDRITMHSPVAYNPDATCLRWERFLEEVFAGNAELVDYIWRASGYSLTGITREQCLQLGCGTGWNGKTIFRTVQEELLGDYAANTPFSTLEFSGRYSIPNDLAALHNKRLVTATEASEGRRLNEARLKMLAGEDSVTARFLHGEFFTFKPMAKFWLSFNHKPGVRDDSTGFWRKVRLIPFTQSFKGRADKNLDDKLRGEYPGILAWMVRGCLEWQKRGLEPPDVVEAATEEYRAESDPLADFITEACSVKPEATTRASRLYKRYRRWAEDAGLNAREVLSSTKFGTAMAERFTKRHTEYGWFYGGVMARLDGLEEANG